MIQKASEVYKIMNQHKQQLINFLSEIYGVDAASVKKNLKGYTTKEEHNDDLQYYVYNNELAVVLNEYLDCAVVKRFRNTNGAYDGLDHDYILHISDFTFCEYKTNDYSNIENINDFKAITNNIFSNEALLNGDWGAWSVLRYLLENVDLADINDNIDNYYICSAEELLFDCGDNIPDYVRRYVDLQAFIDDLTYDQYIDLGDGENVLYYGN